MKRSHILLPILALALILAIYYGWQNYPHVRRITDDSTTAQSRESRQSVTIDAASRLNFGSAPEVKYHPPRRDLFGGLFPPPKVVKPKVVPQVVKPPVVEVVKPPLPPPPPPVAPAVVQRMPAFKSLGYLGKKDQLIAFVALGEDIFLVRQGQTFADEYQVAELTPESITIKHVNGGGSVNLPLTGEGQTAKSVPGGNFPRGVPLNHPPLRGMQ